MKNMTFSLSYIIDANSNSIITRIISENLRYFAVAVKS